MSETLDEEPRGGLNMQDRSCKFCIHNSTCSALREMYNMQQQFDVAFKKDNTGEFDFVVFPFDPLDLGKACSQFAVSRMNLPNEGV
jgi:hypothetical protein